ncbi:hypothetical protein [Bacillus phage SDFMU_Pbc]|uniref:Uncharacterized protein n=1 Tax=Bacillus phage SDFMU_Pbc TaxID=3076135 RepID=A0AA96KR78_9CAUD|nr:hypothetical protein [Bacillus phage SDFMU_Pbc]
MIKNTDILTNDLRLLVTKDQNKALNKLNQECKNPYSLASTIKNGWKFWNKKEPSADSIYYPLGELEMHDVIAAAVSGNYTTHMDAETIIKYCMDTADDQEVAVMERVLEILRSYNTK